MAKLLARVAPWLPLARPQPDPEGPWSFRVLGEAAQELTAAGRRDLCQDRIGRNGRQDGDGALAPARLRRQQPEQGCRRRVRRGRRGGRRVAGRLDTHGQYYKMARPARRLLSCCNCAKGRCRLPPGDRLPG